MSLMNKKKISLTTERLNMLNESIMVTTSHQQKKKLVLKTVNF